MYHNTVHCIVAGMAAGGQILSQYKNCIVRNSGKRQGCLCRKTGSCVTTRSWARQAARAGALGSRLGAQGGRRRTLGVRRAGAGRAGAGRAGGARARRRGASSRGRRQRASGSAQQARGRRATCAHRLGQLGASAPGLVFNPVFRLGIFPESLNEHCSLQNNF